MKMVLQEFPDYKLVFWGDGQDLEQSKKMAIELGLEHSIDFAGVSNNVIQDINKSDIFLLTSDYEGIPNALLEAMSIGMPCVATDCSPGGARMLLEDGKNGILTRMGDPRALADAIGFLIRSPREKKKLEKGRKHH